MQWWVYRTTDDQHTPLAKRWLAVHHRTGRVVTAPYLNLLKNKIEQHATEPISSLDLVTHS